MTSTVEVLGALQDSALGQVIAQSNHLVGVVAQVFHVLGLIMLLAAVLFINLRLAGLAFKAQPVVQLAREPKRIFWWGFASAATSGVLMFCSSPLLYWANPAFILKAWLFVGALLLQVTLYRYVTTRQSPARGLAAASVVLSTVLWFGVGFAGRAVGFV